MTKAEEQERLAQLHAKKPAFARGDRVNVDGIGEAMEVLAVRLSPAKGWFVEARFEDGRAYYVPAERAWTP